MDTSMMNMDSTIAMPKDTAMNNIDMSKMDMPKMDMSKMNMGDQNEITLNYDMLWAAASKDYVVYEFQSVDTSYLHKINLLAARNLQPMIHPKLF